MPTQVCEMTRFARLLEEAALEPLPHKASNVYEAMKRRAYQLDNDLPDDLRVFMMRLVESHQALPTPHKNTVLESVDAIRKEVMNFRFYFLNKTIISQS